MTLCAHCQPQGFRIDTTGHCEGTGHANLYVCELPTTRPDLAFHGERCRCNCNRLFCRYHFASHVAGEHTTSTTAHCFPQLTASTAALAAISASSDLTRQVGGNPRHVADLVAIEDYLQHVAPGGDQLAAATADASNVTAIYGPAHTIARFGEFLTIERLPRIIVLALRDLGLALPWLDARAPDSFDLIGAVRDSDVAWSRLFEPAIVQALTDEANRDEFMGPSAGTSTPWFVTVMGAFDDTTRSACERVLQPLRYNLARLPSSDRAIAEWLTRGPDDDDVQPARLGVDRRVLA